MAKKVDGTFADAWKPENPGETFTGTYLGRQQAEGDKGKFWAYHFKSEDGKRVSISGAGLDNKMVCVPRRTPDVRITYEGKKKMGKGDMKVFEVTVPDDVTLLDPFDVEEEEAANA